MGAKNLKELLIVTQGYLPEAHQNDHDRIS